MYLDLDPLSFFYVQVSIGIWDSNYPTSKICLKMHWITLPGYKHWTNPPFLHQFCFWYSSIHNTFIASSIFIISVLVMEFDVRTFLWIQYWFETIIPIRSWTFELLDSSITIICYYSITVSSLAWLLLYHNETIWVKTQRGTDKLL